MHTPYHTELIKFMESHLRNQWIEHPNIRIYVRKAVRHLPGIPHVLNVLDIANVSVIEEMQRKGTFKDWLTEAEEVAVQYEMGAIYIESVLNPILLEFLGKRGYRETGARECPSFYRFCPSL